MEIWEIRNNLYSKCFSKVLDCVMCVNVEENTGLCLIHLYVDPHYLFANLLFFRKQSNKRKIFARISSFIIYFTVTVEVFSLHAEPVLSVFHLVFRF